MIEALYYLSLAVVIVSALVVALHSAIPGGFVGATCLGGVAVFAMAGFDSDPPRWLVGFTASLAATCIWALTRWRMQITRRLLDECTKVGGTD